MPSVVWLPVATGLAEVLQQTPRAVTVAPPSKVTFPPLIAVIDVILLTAVVVSVGIVIFKVAAFEVTEGRQKWLTIHRNL